MRAKPATPYDSPTNLIVVAEKSYHLPSKIVDIGGLQSLKWEVYMFEKTQLLYRMRGWF